MTQAQQRKCAVLVARERHEVRQDHPGKTERTILAQTVVQLARKAAAAANPRESFLFRAAAKRARRELIAMRAA